MPGAVPRAHAAVTPVVPDGAGRSAADPPDGPRQLARTGQAADGSLRLDRRDTRIGIEASLLPPLFDRPGVAMVATDMAGRVTALSPHAELLLGFGEAELVGDSWHERVHYQRLDGSPLPPQECPLLAAIRQARAADGAGQVFVRKDGTTMPVAWAVAPIVLAGVKTGAVLAFYDNGDRGEPVRDVARLEAVQAANIRLTLLADASHALISAPDLRAGLAAVARLLVPAVADWVVLDLLDEQTGRIERAALAHRHPALEAQGVARLGSLPSLRADMTSPMARILRGGPTLHLTHFPPEDDAVDELGRARLQLFHLLGTTDAITAPMRTPTRTVGAITLVRSDRNRPYEAADLTFAGELATRAAFAAENADLLEQYARRAETMQRMLLPQVPAALAGARLGHLYRPADDLLRVGGDWYDAFPLADGSIGLVIGDVAGHDLYAATRMGAIRHKLRALAADRVAAPSDVVGRLDVVVQRLAPGDLATLLYARLVPAALDPAGEARLEWSSAGHPPPLLLAAGAPPSLLDTTPDLPIGVEAGGRTDQCGTLPPGSTVVLYTDGLVERAQESLDVGLGRLVDRARVLADTDVEDLPTRLVAAVGPASTDDVAVLAVRVP